MHVIKSDLVDKLWLKDIIMIHRDHNSLEIISNVKTGNTFKMTLFQAPSMLINAILNALKLLGALLSHFRLQLVNLETIANCGVKVVR